MDWNWIDTAVGGAIGLIGAYISVRGALAAARLQADKAEAQRRRKDLEDTYIDALSLFNLFHIEALIKDAGVKLGPRAEAQFGQLSAVGAKVRLTGDEKVRTSCRETWKIICQLIEGPSSSEVLEKVKESIQTLSDEMKNHLEAPDNVTKG